MQRKNFNNNNKKVSLFNTEVIGYETTIEFKDVCWTASVQNKQVTFRVSGFNASKGGPDVNVINVSTSGIVKREDLRTILKNSIDYVANEC